MDDVLKYRKWYGTQRKLETAEQMDKQDVRIKRERVR